MNEVTKRKSCCVLIIDSKECYYIIGSVYSTYKQFQMQPTTILLQKQKLLLHRKCYGPKSWIVYSKGNKLFQPTVPPALPLQQLGPANHASDYTDSRTFDLMVSFRISLETPLGFLDVFHMHLHGNLEFVQGGACPFWYCGPQMKLHS